MRDTLNTVVTGGAGVSGIEIIDQVPTESLPPWLDLTLKLVVTGAALLKLWFDRRRSR